MSNWDGLTPMQIDALKEIGNIGIGNATTALATMVQRKINMEVPRAEVRHFEDIFYLVGSAEEVVSCVNLAVHGDAPGRILFLLGHSSSLCLIDLLMGNPAGTTKIIGEMETSALQEVGNILAGSFLNSFSQVTGLSMYPSVPAFAHDMLGAILSSALIEAGYYAERALFIQTAFHDEGIILNGHFFLLPETGALDIILNSLGISE
ncbi:MAG: chemotaxis protein CheC [Syntrophomonadaceae bacterium]|nr:chemotaxis protein CheC [Syntrophomonadaceae bacterium]